MSVPGSLRIDFTPTSAGNGILFTDGKIFVFKDGKVDTTKPYNHPLLILGFDIYRSPASEVTAKLQALKFDLSQFREDTWAARAVYVVGAKAGDLHSPQFWIDQKNLYLIRMLPLVLFKALSTTEKSPLEPNTDLGCPMMKRHLLLDFFVGRSK